MTSSENAGGHCGQRNCAPPPCVEASVLWAQLRLRSPRPTATAAAFAMYGSRRPRPPTAPWTLDAGLAMVTQGMAWWYRAYAPEQTPEARGQYEFAEAEAKARRVGLWSDREPVAPWEWRKGNRTGAGP